MVLTPNLNVDGIYTLEVQAQDRAGNLSGAHHYRVRFEVGGKSHAKSLNAPLTVFPNPGSDYVNFNYNHTTEQLPQSLDLYIL